MLLFKKINNNNICIYFSFFANIKQNKWTNNRQIKKSKTSETKQTRKINWFKKYKILEKILKENYNEENKNM